MLTKWPEPLIATAPLFACLVPVLGLVVSRPPLCGLVCHRLCRWMGPVAVDAAGYVVKSAAADELSRAIEAVTNGRQFISALVGETSQDASRHLRSCIGATVRQQVRTEWSP